MSDTPKTDANCGWPWGHHGRIECSDLRWSPDGPFVHSEVTRHLERENAALRERVDAWKEEALEHGAKLHTLEHENAALADENRRLHVELDAYHNGEQLRVLRACVDRTGEANDRLVAENAALRAELQAQAVVNGKGGEREAKLLAEIAGLRGALEESQEYGRNHANAVMKLLSVISRIRFAVDSQPHRSQAMRLEDVGDLCDEVLGKKSAP